MTEPEGGCECSAAGAVRVVYQLTDSYGGAVGGPVTGPPGLDLSASATWYRAERYAAAEAAKDDYCFVSDDDFLGWLIEKKVVQPLAHQLLPIVIESTGEHAYVPKHWPLCPECGRGRGEEEMGRVLRGLNRAEWFRKCTECGHAWGHQDLPYMSGKPMLDDDGRYTEGGCVPYTISQVGGLPIAGVLEACRERGWSEGFGMHDQAGLSVARAFGLEVMAVPLDGVRGRLTLRRVLDRLSAEKNYIIATNCHWLPIVRGENRDPAETSMRSEVLNCWEVGRQAGCPV